MSVLDKTKEYGRVQLKHPATYDGNKRVGTLAKALAIEAECGCGIECECYGYITLPNYNGLTGEVEGYVAIYIIDGNLVVDPVDIAQEAITSLKSL